MLLTASTSSMTNLSLICSLIGRPPSSHSSCRPCGNEVIMKSRAQLQSHPLHPALIPFPFAFLTGSAVCDVIGVAMQRPSLWSTGAHLQVAGIAAGVLAAIPGAIDYIYTVPPNSSGKQRATRHALGNGGALLLFALAWVSRGVNYEPGGLSLAASIAGALLLAYSGYLGGTLVTRNLISIDHRYA